MLIFGAGIVHAEPVRIAALGDSLTAGYGLPPEDGLTAQLQRWLDARGAQVTIINAGVSGDTTAGGLARVDWTLGDDVDAMIVALGANDYLRGLDPNLTRENLDGILTAAGDRAVPVMLVQLEVGANYGTDYKEKFDAIYPELATAHEAVLVPGFFESLIVAEGNLVDYLQADGLHPTASGVALIVDDLGPRVQDFAAGLD